MDKTVKEKAQLALQELESIRCEDVATGMCGAKEASAISRARVLLQGESSYAPFTNEHFTYVLHYGTGCRDCADEDGVCPHSGLPCELKERRAAIATVLGALSYGVKNGFIPAPVFSTEKGPETLLTTSECRAARNMGWAIDLVTEIAKSNYYTSATPASWELLHPTIQEDFFRAACESLPLSASDFLRARSEWLPENHATAHYNRAVEELFFRWAYKALIALAKLELEKANKEAGPGEWPAQQSWEQLGPSSRGSFLFRARDRAKIPHDEFLQGIRDGVYEVDDLLEV